MTRTMAGHRVKLKNHVYFGVVPDGVLFDAGDTSFVLKDKSAYPLVEKLIALIDAGNPVESILEHAPAKLADFFRRILASLAEHGMLLTVDEEAPSANQLAAHTTANELRKFLEDRLGGRAVDAALRRWHDAPVIVMGCGHALLSAVRALTDSGCARLTVVPDGGSTGGLEALRDELASAQASRFVIRAAHEGDPPLDAAGMLLYASDGVDMALVTRVEDAMRANGIAGAIGAVFDGRACVLPTSLPGRPGVCDLLHWLPPKEDDEATLGPVAMSLLGCVVAQAAICRFFGVEAAATGGQVAVVSPGLEVEYRMLVGSASSEGAPVPFVHPSKYEMPMARPLLPFERAKFALEPWFDPLLGPFAVVADDDIEQVPLMQYPVRVRSASVIGKEEIVVGWGLEHAAAVIRGLSRAVEALASSFRNDGKTVVCAFEEDIWKRRALAHAVAISDEMATRHRWAWVDPEQLPPGPARVMYALLRFHAPDGIRLQIQWVDAGDAYIVRVLHEDAVLCSAIAEDPATALEEGLGDACSRYQLQALRAARFAATPGLPAADAAAQVADWHEAMAAAGAAGERQADFHLFAAPGFPPTVYCGHATLKATASAQ